MSQRTYHQDYIARIRYANTLPPPPGPPKLLNVPGTGLGDGKYTSAAYASRLVRKEPLNIEADAELGMPIDLVGLPGVFDGDESCIHALDQLPPIHPHDKDLLKPASALGRDVNTANLSFLRRSEMLASSDSIARRNEAQARRPPINGENARKKARIDTSAADEPAAIIRDIEKSFQLANPETPAIKPEYAPASNTRHLWNKPVHPQNPRLKLVDSYPILPDVEAMPDLGSWMVTNFNDQTLKEGRKVHDPRLDVALIRPREPSRAKKEEYEMKQAAHAADPNEPDPGPPAWDYDLYLLNDAAEAAGIKAEATDDSTRAPNDNAAPERAARTYNQYRLYQTQYQNTHLGDVFAGQVALALHDENAGSVRQSLPKGAYVYPISQTTKIKPIRVDIESRPGRAPEPEEPEEPKIDAIDLTLRRPNEEEASLREKAKELYDSKIVSAEA